MDVKPKNRAHVLSESVPINTSSLPSYSTMLPYSSSRTSFSSSLFLKVPITRPGKGEFTLSSTWLDAMKASSPTATCTKNQSNKNLSSSVIDLAYKSWMLKYPSALDFFDKITSSAKGKRIALFLDYDGTLSPIVEDPDSAFMSPSMRAAVKNVAKRFPTAIISGRSRDKVYEFVQLSELYYAGSHGMDIAAPTIRPVWDTHLKSTGFSNHQVGSDLTVFHPASEFLPMIEEVYHSFIEATKHIKGAFVENNKFCVSLHYRNVEENSWLSIGQIADRILRQYTQLRLTHGRKVLEVRPMINWDKGKAVEFLLESLGLGGCEDVLPIYVGDDRTDEDAFKVLKERQQGFGVLVSSMPKESDAFYSLKDPSEVMCFLESLAKWRS